VTLDQLRTLARARLVAANATLVIAGRIDARRALTMVQTYFGSMPRAPAPNKVKEASIAVESRTATVDGIEPAEIVAVPIRDALPLALVVEQLLTAQGFAAELREHEELRITSTHARLDATDAQLRAARTAAEAKLLLELEPLPHRARLLAAGLNLDSLRQRIAKVTIDDVRQFADSVRETAVTIEVRTR
jgi:predicted Zn-dependent peptidase